MGRRLVTGAARPLHGPHAWRVVSRPNAPIAALALLVDDPAELDELIAIEGLTNPFAREALESLGSIPAARRYTGAHAGLVMTPFLLRRESRFSDGTYGILYAGRSIETALRETGYHQARRLTASGAPAGYALRMYSYALAIRSRAIVDLRRDADVDPAISDPDSHAASRRFGRAARHAGHDGIAYVSVRHAKGSCVALFWPDAVRHVVTGSDWLFYFDGRAISEYARASVTETDR